MEHCYVEANLLKRPLLEDTDLEKLVAAFYVEPKGSDVDAKAWAEKVDLNLLSSFVGAPFSIESGASASSAKIVDSENKRYISFDSTASAASSFTAKKNDYMESKTSTTHPTEEITGFENAYGFVAHRPNGGTFTMVYFTILKDGCFVDINIRNNDYEYSATQAAELITKILAAEPA